MEEVPSMTTEEMRKRTEDATAISDLKQKSYVYKKELQRVHRESRANAEDDFHGGSSIDDLINQTKSIMRQGDDDFRDPPDARRDSRNSDSRDRDYDEYKRHSDDDDRGSRSRGERYE